VDLLSGFFSVALTSVGLIMASPVGPAKLSDADYSGLIDRAQPARSVNMRLPTGEMVGQFFTTGPTRAPLEMLPPDFLRAIIATEDRRFFEHRGVDPVGLTRATLSQMSANPRGGSSIDQQLAKNAWTGSGLSLNRKVDEAILALRGRAILGDELILRSYVENVWFGRGVTGAAGAALAWFGKDWNDLSLGEIAYLAAILKGPAYFDAEQHPERAVARRDLVISAMEREGMITAEQADAARAEDLRVIPRNSQQPDIETSWIAAAARPFLTDETAMTTRLVSEEEIELTIDLAWQRLAQEVLTEHIERMSETVPLDRLGNGPLQQIMTLISQPQKLRLIMQDHLAERLPWNSPWQPVLVISSGDEELQLIDEIGEIIEADLADGSYPAQPGDILAAEAVGDEILLHGRTQIEGAVVILDPRNGAVLASVGGANPKLSSFDRTRAERQPGSSIKSFLWLAALNAGYIPSTPVPDFEQTYMIDGVEWRPRNYSGLESGMVTLSSAYEQSSNLVAAALINALGPEAMGVMAQRAGAYPQGMRPHPTAALGTIETTLLDLTSGHATIVNDGAFRAPSVIWSKTLDGTPVVQDGIRMDGVNRGAGPIASRESLLDMTSMMRGVVTRGTASRAFSNHPVTIIGKTGTTQDYRDGWFVGLTPHLAIGVWIGRDDNKGMAAAQSGGRAAAPIGASILRRALEDGLISAEGYRDERMTSGMPWPPAVVERSTFSGAIQFPSEQGNPVYERRSIQGLQEADPTDPFWRGSPQPEPSPAPQGRHSIPDRNQNLRPQSW
jgi:penicillin-binding protein 1A